MDLAETLFFDPRSGERITYGEVWQEIKAGSVEHAPFQRPVTAGAAVRAVARAVVLRQPLTLFDVDFSESELVTLGGTPEVLAERVALPLVGADSFAQALEQAKQQDGFRLTLFTSGSTGVPKKVTHRLEGLTRTLRQGDKHAASRWGLAYNPTHIAGVQVILQALFNRNPLIHLFQAERSLVRQAVGEYGITHISATPSFYRLLLPVEQALTGVRAVTLGGERSDAGLLGKLAELFPSAKVRNLYASTEAGTLLVADGEAFILAPGLENKIRIVENQLEIHSSLLGEFEAGREKAEWYGTGDVVEVLGQEPLRFRILSRDRDWVNVGGHKVNPGEVEECLLACAGVREARVYARANSVLGQILCAEVVTDGEFSEAVIRANLAEKLQAAKIPRLIKQVAEVKRTRTGKVART